LGSKSRSDTAAGL